MFEQHPFLREGGGRLFTMSFSLLYPGRHINFPFSLRKWTLLPLFDLFLFVCSLDPGARVDRSKLLDQRHFFVCSFECRISLCRSAFFARYASSFWLRASQPAISNRFLLAPHFLVHEPQRTRSPPPSGSGTGFGAYPTDSHLSFRSALIPERILEEPALQILYSFPPPASP